MSKTLLISGATGKQGRAVISALHDLPESNQFTILALTRSPTSASAQSLSKKFPEVKFVTGDLNDCPAVFETARRDLGIENIWGVFSVQVPFGGGATTESEERQGKALVDAALAHGVQHFVYTSVDRHGSNSDNDPTNVPHFISKHNVEKYLESKCQGDGKMQYTILRPVAFMDNLTPDFQGKAFPAMWQNALGQSEKLQLISVKDIGWFAAQAFAKPVDYKGQKISLAGDDLTLDEAKEVFQETVGKPLPIAWSIVGSAITYFIADMGQMFKWFHDVGYGADIGALKKTYPQLESFRDYLARPENGFVRT